MSIFENQLRTKGGNDFIEWMNQSYAFKPSDTQATQFQSWIIRHLEMLRGDFPDEIRDILNTSLDSRKSLLALVTVFYNRIGELSGFTNQSTDIMEAILERGDMETMSQSAFAMLADSRGFSNRQALFNGILRRVAVAERIERNTNAEANRVTKISSPETRALHTKLAALKRKLDPALTQLDKYKRLVAELEEEERELLMQLRIHEQHTEQA